MAFSDQFLDELRGRVGLADVIGRRVKLVRKGREFHGLCPFHKEKTPSFTVNEEKGFYHCFGCQSHGSIFDYVMETEGLNFPEAVEKLAGEAGMEVPRDTPEERVRQQQRQTLIDVSEAAAGLFEKALHMPEGKAALDYLRGRGLSDEIIKRFRLGFAPSGRNRLKTALARLDIPEDLSVTAGLLIRPPEDRGDDRAPYDRFRGRVMFPIADRRGRVVAFGGRILGEGEPKYLNSPETPLFHKGHILYGMDLAAPAARQADTIIVTEGYMDVIALAQAGFDHAVAPLGTALTEDQIHLLWKTVREPVVCFDGDKAGQRAAAKAAERALPHLKPGYGLRFAHLPLGEDPDSLVIKNGPAAMQDVLDAALPLSEVLWELESGGSIPASAEDRAGLESRLKDHTRRIESPDVRKHFARLFGERLWPDGQAGYQEAYQEVYQETYRPASGGQDDQDRGNQGQNWSQKKWTKKKPLRGSWEKGFGGTGYRGKGYGDHAPTEYIDSAKGREAGTLEVRREDVLVAVVINHPDVFDDIEERLGTRQFEGVKLDKIRQEVLKALADKPGLETGALIAHLNQCGYTSGLQRILSAETYNHSKFARPEASIEEALDGWSHLYRLLQSRDLDKEIEEATRASQNNPSEEAKRHLQFLTRQKLSLTEEEFDAVSIL